MILFAYTRLRALSTAWLLRTKVRVRALAAGSRVRVFISSVTHLPADTRVTVGRGIRAKLVVDHDCSIGRRVTLRVLDGSIVLSRGAHLADGVTLESHGSLVVGDRVVLDTGASVVAGGDVVLEDGVRLGEYVTLRSTPEAPVHIGPGALVGPHANVKAGAAIGGGTLVAPHGTVPGHTSEPEREDPRSPVLEPEVSVVVTTRNRSAFVPGLIEGLRSQTVPPGRFELVATDDGSTDGTEELLRRAAREVPFELRVVRQPSPEGPAAGRNVAWRTARGRIVAFTDDDCIPAPNWLREGLLALEGGQDVVQGRTVPVAAELVDYRGFAASQFVVEESVFSQTCNMLYRRVVLEAVDGFDESFRFSGEDADLGWRAREAGYRFGFSHGALVHHVVHRNGLLTHLRSFWKFRDVARLPKRHPGTRRGYFARYFWTSEHAWFLLAVGGVVGGAFVSVWGYLLCAPYSRLLWARDAETTILPIRLLRVPARVVAVMGEIGTLLIGSIRRRTPLL